jgi:hypothetical protein
MALPKIGDGEQVGDGNTGEVLNVGRSGQSLQIGGASTTTIGVYGATPVVQRAAAIQAASVVSVASYISVSTNLSVFCAEVAACLTGLGLWKGAA